ncbi:sensor histidine kinase [Nakamurella leprariae]|uniref:histidine kinase n=1 Tax=Nakamurella leprariae TaxID=2803911 RepID=A0A939C087_9ACTN|nr:ATP-binding protein [Nakamurella leprariae]MBM9465912.1 histidine kinase [Nakamurella leprariae]
MDTSGSAESSDVSGRPVVRCDIDELRSLFLFESLDDEQLAWLCGRGRIEEAEPGVLLVEGEPARQLWILMEGTIATSRHVGQDDVEVTRTDHRGSYSGAVQAYLGERSAPVYLHSLRALSRSRFFVLEAEDFAAFMRTWFPMALHLLAGLFYGNQATQQAVGQRERLLALGSLSAGLTHELNNPAAAAVRATASLRERVAGMRHKLALVADGPFDRVTLAALVGLQEEAVETAGKHRQLSAMEAADREDAIGDWFDERGLSGGWELAPTFVQAGVDQEFLDRVESTVGGAERPLLEGAVRWLAYAVETEQLLDEIHDATTRVSTLVNSAKQYSQLDRAPFQQVDVHELLDSTLVMMGRKIGPGLRVAKEYDRALPAVPAYAAELNQVWTNLIDNAIDAMGGVDGTGTLTLRTEPLGDQVRVSVGDTGPGVPEALQDRIFEPFFTTKPVGQGTGLGLDISWRVVVKKHHGDLRVRSRPGATWFDVTLPLSWVPATPATPPTLSAPATDLEAS